MPAPAHGSAPARRAYGPTALATPANLVTLARILAAPVFVWLVLERSPSWLVFAVGFAVGITDLLDGWLARRHGGTRSGAFLDPLADKVLVLGGMAALVRVGQFAVVPVALIAARELAVSVYRSGAGRRGISVPATRAAKHKTFVQLWSIGFAIMPPIAENAHWVATATLWVAVVLTLATGAAYLRAASRAGRAGRAAPYLRAASDVRAASAGTPGARAAPHPRTARTVEP